MSGSARRISNLLHAIAAAALLSTAAAARADDVLVFAAASLKPALDNLLDTPAAKAIGTIKPSYGASSQLAKQIEAGAPAAVFVSADKDWMDYVEARHLVEPGTRVDLLGNALVLVAHKDHKVRLSLRKPAGLLPVLRDGGHLAMAEPGSVPAGKYGKAALTELGVWTDIEPHVVAADNVRAALNFVVRGEAPLGIVYRSDATSEPSVRIVDEFPEETHEPIVYPLALIKGHVSEEAKKLHALLRSPQARETFERFGFSMLRARP